MNNYLLYIDPGSGSLIINLLVTIIGALFFYSKKIFFWIIRKKNVENNNNNNIKIGLYSEGENYLSTFEPLVNSFIKNKVLINYYTSSYNDPILNIHNKFLISKYIGKGLRLSYLFSKINNRILISTTPNIGNRNYILKKPKAVENLVHIFHSIVGIEHYRKGSLDYYDTVIIGSAFQKKNIRKIEKNRSLKKKEILRLGIPFLDKKIKPSKKKDHVLIASSWGGKSLINSFDIEFIKDLINLNYKIIMRPHPHSFEYEPHKLNRLKKELGNKNIVWDSNISPDLSISKSFLLISDTSSIRFEFLLKNKSPIITLKINKNNMTGFEIENLNSSWENKMESSYGYVINPGEESRIISIIENLKSKNNNTSIEKKFFNFGYSSEVIAKYFKKC